MSGFDNKAWERDPALQHSDSGVAEPAPLLWGEIHHTHRRVREPRGSSLSQWLKETLNSWKSVFRRPRYLAAERGN